MQRTLVADVALKKRFRKPNRPIGLQTLRLGRRRNKNVLGK
jgi:hypothetical protein